MEAKKKTVVVSFADVSGGCNTIEHPTGFNNNQVNGESCGFQLRKTGIVRYPGATGDTAGTFNGFVRLLTNYKQFDGNEARYCVSGGKIYLVNI